MVKRLVLALALTLVVVAAAWAHDLFLKLETYFVPAGTAVRVAVLNGSFTNSEAAVQPGRLRDLSLVGPAGRQSLPRESWQPRGDTTWLTVRTADPGTYVVGASLTPREIALSADDFNSYLKEDGLPDVLEARTRQGELGRAVRERYHKHVKAILQVGERRTDGYGAVLGYPAEIVPLDNPYAPHDSVGFRCLVDGKPVARQLVIAGGEARGERIAETEARTNDSGVVYFPLTAPGRWYVKFIAMMPVSADSVNYESKWATITFEVR